MPNSGCSNWNPAISLLYESEFISKVWKIILHCSIITSEYFYKIKYTHVPHLFDLQMKMFLKDNTLLMDLLQGSQLRKDLTIQMLILVEACLLTTVPCHLSMPQTIDVETGKHGQQYAWSEKEMRSLF